MTTLRVKSDLDDCCIPAGSPEDGLVSSGSEADGVLPDKKIDRRVKSRSRCSSFFSASSLTWMLVIFTSCIIFMSSSSFIFSANAARTQRSPQIPSPSSESVTRRSQLRSTDLSNNNQQNEINNETEEPSPQPKVEKIANNTPVIESMGQTLTVRENSSVLLPCRVKDLGEFVVVWRMGLSKILYAGHLQVWKDDRIKLANYDLRINDVKEADSGDYVCFVSTKGASEVTHTVIVQVPPTIDPTPNGTSRLAAKKGENVDLGCFARGKPTPSVRWRKNSIVNGRDSWTDAGSGYGLTIWNVSRTETGTYQCTATNEVGEASVSFRLDVLYAPEVEVDDRILHTGVAIDATLTCRVWANPPADVIWTREKDSRQIEKTTDKFIVDKSETEATLKIVDMSPDDFDNYTCVANNTYGVRSERIELVGSPSRTRIKSRKKVWIEAESPYYDLSWEVASYAPITGFRVSFRRVKTVQNDSMAEEEEWKQIEDEIPVRPSSSFSNIDRDFVYPHLTKITEIQWNTPYQVQVEVKNEFGWNRPNEPFEFIVVAGSTPPGYTGSSLSVSPSNGFFLLLVTSLLILHVRDIHHN